jgi:ribosomal-protein-alanine N-acetyltransferase
MEEIILRKMTLEDVDAVTELDEKSFEKDAWSRRLFIYEAENPNAEYTVAEIDGKIIACIGINIFEDTAYISTIAVDTEFRRRGIGQKLIAESISIAQNLGAKYMLMEVRCSNIPSISIFKKFGFKVLRREEKYYSDGEDAFLMGRKI